MAAPTSIVAPRIVGRSKSSKRGCLRPVRDERSLTTAYSPSAHELDNKFRLAGDRVVYFAGFSDGSEVGVVVRNRPVQLTGRYENLVRCPGSSRPLIRAATFVSTLELNLIAGSYFTSLLSLQVPSSTP
jgi:hypothetical protein